MIPNKLEHSIPVIYLITNTVNGKIYVGSAKNFYRRYKDYEKFERRKGPTRYIEYAIRQYGFNKFEFSILEYVNDITQLVSREQHYLDTLRPFSEIGYNICQHAYSTLGNRHTAETKKKISEANTGIKHSIEFGEAVRRRRIGIRASDISRKKMSEAGKRRWALMSKEYKKDIVSKTGAAHVLQLLQRCERAVYKIDKVTLSIVAEYRSAVMADRLNGYPESSVNQVCRENPQRHTMGGFYWCYKDVYHNTGFVKPHASGKRAVRQLDDHGTLLRVWNSIKEAATSVGALPPLIRRCCENKRRHCRGYRWEFVEIR